MTTQHKPEIEQAILDVAEAEKQMLSISEQRAELINKHKAAEFALSEITSKIRSRRHWPDDQYRAFLQQQQIKKNLLRDISEKLGKLKIEFLRWQKLREEIKTQAGPAMREYLADQPRNMRKDSQRELELLRDKYMQFSQDFSRVNSMRLMAAQVASELTAVINMFR